MNNFFILSAVFAFSYAQSLDSEQPSSVIGVPGPRWRGPFANHVLGQSVPDTPAVAEAKLAHYRAHAEVLAILPTLSPEERYIQSETTQNPVQNNWSSHEVQYQNVQPQYHTEQPHFQNHPQQIPTEAKIKEFAEDIPRSELGETPEVHAARLAHLKAREEISKNLPQLDTNYQTRVGDQQWYYNPLQKSQVNVFPTDTPEVAAAKQEHLRLYAAALTQG
ncbi:hypothetical protein WA026_006036 [Henosepilachna vigintioctopunctata]|uniref:Uncharacterized protein n=1 Tax=Henosepilachna vigintioctopunctata TaxID=420089 RepID=A0AAW1THT0_9CUCU